MLLRYSYALQQSIAAYSTYIYEKKILIFKHIYKGMIIAISCLIPDDIWGTEHREGGS